MRSKQPPPPGLTPAEDVARAGRRSGGAAPGTVTTEDPELAARRDRLVEKLAVMQSDLGGLFYEMAIRDAVNMEVLLGKAAELQRVDAELGSVERALRLGSEGAAGTCPSCGALHARGAAFCADCGTPLRAPAA